MSQEMNFEEMRNQIAILRNKLENQEIVNDRLLRSSMQTKVNKMNRTESNVLCLVVLDVILFPALHYLSGISWPMIWATTAMVLFCAVATIYIHRPLHKADLMSDDLATVSGILARFKHQYDVWLHYYTPALILPWLAWFCYDFTQAMGITGKERWYACTPLLMGGLVGFIIGYRMHRNTVNLAEEVMRELGKN